MTLDTNQQILCQVWWRGNLGPNNVRGGHQNTKTFFLSKFSQVIFCDSNHNRTDRDWTRMAHNSGKHVGRLRCLSQRYNMHDARLQLFTVFLFRTSKMNDCLRGFVFSGFLLSFFFFFFWSDNPEAVWKMNKTHFHWEWVCSETQMWGYSPWPA